MSSGKESWALLFDCDGVLADTERDGHRPAFNQAFKEKGELWTIPPWQSFVLPLKRC